MSTEGNPFFVHDVSVLIDAFSNPLATTKTVTKGIVETIEGVPSWLKQVGGDSSVAALSNRLQEQLDQARGAIDALYSYGTANQPTQTTSIPGIPGLVPSVEGIRFKNTVATIMDSDNVGDALKTLVADCIPCKDRVIALLSVNPIEDLWGHFDRMYKQSISFLLDLYDLVLGDHSVEIFQDFCNLFNFLSFMCVPDLAGMILMLSRLITKYAIEMEDIKISFVNIMSRIAGPALAPLMATVDKYITLIVAPVECMIAALDAQLQKMDVVQAWKKNIRKEDAERTFSLQSVAGPLQALKKYLTDSVQEVKKEFEKLDKSMQDLLGLQDELNKHMFDLSRHIEMCTRFIGLIQAIIVALSQGEIRCDGNNDWNNTEDLKNFITNRLTSDMSIVIQEDQAVIKPNLPPNLSTLLQTVATYQREEPDLTTVKTTEIQVPVAQATISFKNCLYTVNDPELSKAKDFLDSL